MRPKRSSTPSTIARTASRSAMSASHAPARPPPASMREASASASPREARVLIATVAPRLAAALGQKLAAQAVPVLGAVSGAALNAAFLRYYREVARIRFALMRLAVQHGGAAVAARFAEATAAPRITRNR